MQPGDLAVAVLLPLRALIIEDLGELLDRLALPGGDLGRMNFVLDRKLCHRLVALNRLKRYLGLELSGKSSPCPHGRSSSISAKPPYPAVSESGTTSLQVHRRPVLVTHRVLLTFP